jgi:hypothetical protein
MVAGIVASESDGLVTKAQRKPSFELWKSRVVTATPRPILAQILRFCVYRLNNGYAKITVFSMC